MIRFLSWTYMLHLLEGRNQKPEMGRKGCKETEGSNGNQECVSGLSNGTADLKGYETLRGKLRTDFPRAHMVNLHPGMESGTRETQALWSAAEAGLLWLEANIPSFRCRLEFISCDFYEIQQEGEILLRSRRNAECGSQESLPVAEKLTMGTSWKILAVCVETVTQKPFCLLKWKSFAFISHSLFFKLLHIIPP